MYEDRQKKTITALFIYFLMSRFVKLESRLRLTNVTNNSLLHIFLLVGALHNWLQRFVTKTNNQH